MIQTFAEWLKREQKNGATIRFYTKEADKLLSFLREEGILLAEVKEVHVQRFLDLCKSKGYSSHSVAKTSSSIRSFFKHLRNEGVMIHNPMDNIKQPKTTKREVTVSEQELDEIRQRLRNSRDRVMFSMLTYERIRLNDMIRIRLDHFEPKQGIIYLDNKAYPLSECTKRDMVKHIEQEGITDYIFLNQHRKPLTSQGAYYIIKQYFIEIGKPDIRPIDLVKLG
ncbi:site-specific integrase (plasmid) [Pontibacillus sp. ALD_SL1]|uniref:tyrosine-type recombinase/integrase n=1 Tax=Pontibacillus sp. ALD_SL1 TaxID=2777185 RepID=UPI001A97B422|nr:site-specific integrase [Pontibacillus sp. ALD_SL1]QST03080.1 site-specific integrase [Pontibacillus sp. ALD_SL1]